MKNKRNKGSHSYAEIVKAFSEEDGHVYLPRIVTGKV